MLAFRQNVRFLIGSAALVWLCAAAAAESLPIRSGDVAGFVGGGDVVAAQFAGHLEAVLTLRFENVRFRSFAWEGDTVYAQPREIGFPTVHDLVKSNGVTVLMVQFGRTEALEGTGKLPAFKDAYRKFIEKCESQTSRVIIVTPPPYESAGGLLPNLASRNADLDRYVESMVALAKEKKLPLVDVFHQLGGTNHAGLSLTENGLQLTERGHVLVAEAFAKEAGIRMPAPGAAFEQLRQAIVAKNKLWFDYSRPQNWAFLGGDRTHVQSSHDHIDMKIRWFPAEMQKFIPLIEAKEKEIAWRAGAAEF